MKPYYEIGILGDPSSDQLASLFDSISEMVLPYGFTLGEEIGWSVGAEEFDPRENSSSVVVFFGCETGPSESVDSLIDHSIPILPVLEGLENVSSRLPASLLRFNCLDYSAYGPSRVASAALECLGLLPRQRRVFLSYRRDEARQAALQLFDRLSARLFDVFLDTHGIPPAVDFQEMLWHRLCDADVLLMLDTPTYFESRWTSAEFGRALAKGISVLRVGWPDSTPSKRTETASRVELVADEVDLETGALAEDAVERIAIQLEILRSESLAVRTVNMVSSLRHHLERIGGTIDGIGEHKIVNAELPDGRHVKICAATGVPTSITLHDAASRANEGSVAVVFDHVGLSEGYTEHLAWIGSHVKNPQWVKASEVAWRFADWEDRK